MLGKSAKIKDAWVTYPKDSFECNNSSRRTAGKPAVDYCLEFSFGPDMRWCQVTKGVVTRAAYSMDESSIQPPAKLMFDTCRVGRLNGQQTG